MRASAQALHSAGSARGGARSQPGQRGHERLWRAFKQAAAVYNRMRLGHSIPLLKSEIGALEPSPSPAASTQLAWRARLAIALAATGLYALLFVPAYSATGVIAASISVIPIGLAGWLLGRRGGAAAGLISIPLHILLFTLAGTRGAAMVLQQWPGSAMGILLGIAIGWLGEFVRHVQDQARDLARERAALRAEIARRERIEQALLQARDAAEAANRAKSTFLANASHELRTPLTAILGYSDLLALDNQRGDLTNLGVDIKKIQSAGIQLLGLIDDVLDLSKIEAGHMRLTPETFELSALVREVSEATQPLFAQNRNRLFVRIGAAENAIYVDRAKLRQILLNLLGNAAKFTSDGSVTLTIDRTGLEVAHADADLAALTGPDASKQASWYILEVSDTGIGMTDQQLQRIFQPFVQAEPTIAQTYGGTGLGLALCRRLCQAMGGTISASSTLGAGSTFTVRLPASTDTSLPLAP
jgi:signal transduction histidine kinase